ncbi:MAG TPA: TIGR02679 family protein [Pirellulales bacterium]|nr:TIGR02679 family protein [Pirellulales bacterium]
MELDPLASRFRQPDLRRLLDRLVERLRRGRPLTGRIRLHDADDSERRAIAALMGGRATSGRSIDLDILTQIAIRDERFGSLRHLVEAAHGNSVEDERGRRRCEQDAWKSLWSEAFDRCAHSDSLRGWLVDLQGGGWIRRRCGDDPTIARKLIDDMFVVLDRLPSQPPIPLAQLSADLFGDSHALDSDTDRGRLSVRAAAALAAVDPPRNATTTRAAWSAVGVVPDQLCATVLVLNLPALSGTPLGDALHMYRRQGEPCRVTFRQLRHVPSCQFDPTAGRKVFVCENPSIVSAAADRLGLRCRPLVSVEGQPNLAAETLLGLLRGQGFSLHYHGDFDWGGIRIARRLWNLSQFVPWRFAAGDYRSVACGRPLKGKPSDTPWDFELRQAMFASGKAVHEESVLHALLKDLHEGD